MSSRRVPAARPMLRRVHASRKAPHGWHKAAARRVAAKQAPPRVQPHSPAPPDLPRSLGRHAYLCGMPAFAACLRWRCAQCTILVMRSLRSRARFLRLAASALLRRSRVCALTGCPFGRGVRAGGMLTLVVRLLSQDACFSGASAWITCLFRRCVCLCGMPALAICSLQRAAYAVGCSLCSIMAPPWGVVSMHSIPRPPRFVKRAAPAKRKIQQGGRIGRSRQVFGQNRTARSRRPVAKSLRPQNACGRLGGELSVPPKEARLQGSTLFEIVPFRRAIMPRQLPAYAANSLRRTCAENRKRLSRRILPQAVCITYSLPPCRYRILRRSRRVLYRLGGKRPAMRCRQKQQRVCRLSGKRFPAAGGMDFPEHDWAIFPCQCASKACATPHFRPGPRQSAPPPAPPPAHFRGLRNHISCSRGIIHSKSRQAKTQGGLSVELCSHGRPSRFRPVQLHHTRPPPPLPERRALIRAG